VNFSGEMEADPICETNIRLQRTSIVFTGTISNGPWGEGALIMGTWTGGDYACDGTLMPGYPTTGLVTITYSDGVIVLDRNVGPCRYFFQ
jgi:hypothetical protein